jgi:hypothetical protein
MSKVYFTKEITPESLIKIYDALEVELKGKVGIKISTGEPGGHNFLNPNLIKDLVQKLNGTIIECCTAYGGKRQDPKDHWQTIEEHGFKKIAPCDIMDEFGEFEIPIKGGFHLNKNIVGEHLNNYDSILMLSHFKGHTMGGFGGALKNMSIGIASHNGKLNIHSAGRTLDQEDTWNNLPAQDDFLESMADACKAVIEYKGKENIAYINVANNLSVDCDCDSNPDAPEMKDIGIFASTDPVALDQACYDAVKNSEDSGKAALIERMDSRHAIRTVEAANELGLGERNYEIICID